MYSTAIERVDDTIALEMTFTHSQLRLKLPSAWAPEKVWPIPINKRFMHHHHKPLVCIVFCMAVMLYSITRDNTKEFESP